VQDIKQPHNKSLQPTFGSFARSSLRYSGPMNSTVILVATSPLRSACNLLARATATIDYREKIMNEFQSKKVAAGICGILLGAFGIHKFILGYQKEGIIMLLVTLLGSLPTFGIAGGIMGLIGLIEGILYLTKSDAEFARVYGSGQKGWF
jgi:TM2 domain-containing membrane protein YozV